MEIKVIPLSMNDPTFPKVEEATCVNVTIVGHSYNAETVNVPDILIHKEDGTTIGYRLPPGKVYALMVES